MPLRDTQGSLFCFGAGQKKKNQAGVGRGGVKSSGQGRVTVKLGAAIFPGAGAGRAGRASLVLTKLSGAVFKDRLLQNANTSFFQR